MRRIIAVVLGAGLSLATLGVIPAHASHCGTANATNCPNPITIAVLEGLGSVCTEANPSLVGANPHCVYHNSPEWTNSPNATQPLSYYDSPSSPGQGLYFPGFGPPAAGPFSFAAGPTTDPGGTGFCASTANIADGKVDGCKFIAYGQLSPGESGLGAYCLSSTGAGQSVFTDANGNVVKASYGWNQSAATILPLTGTVSSPANMKGASVLGFSSARGTGDGANCGVSQVTRVFNVEGMVVTY